MKGVMKISDALRFDHPNQTIRSDRDLPTCLLRETLRLPKRQSLPAYNAGNRTDAIRCLEQTSYLRRMLGISQPEVFFA